MTSIRHLHDVDVDLLCQSLTPAHFQELHDGFDVESTNLPEVLWDQIYESDQVVSLVEGDDVLCIAGFARPESDDQPAQLWCVGGSNIERARLGFSRASRKVIARFLAIEPYLMTMVAADDAPVIRWVEWLGATLTDPFPVGRNGRLFKACIFSTEPRCQPF